MNVYEKYIKKAEEFANSHRHEPDCMNMLHVLEFMEGKIEELENRIQELENTIRRFYHTL